MSQNRWGAPKGTKLPQSLADFFGIPPEAHRPNDVYVHGMDHPIPVFQYTTYKFIGRMPIDTASIAVAQRRARVLFRNAAVKVFRTARWWVAYVA